MNAQNKTGKPMEVWFDGPADLQVDASGGHRPRQTGQVVNIT